jgi:D-3-phosphoglycerate dehydrogenase
MKIVFPDHIDFDEAAKAKIKELGITTYDDTPSDQNVIAQRIRDAEIITFSWITLSHAAIDAAPKLKYIISAAAGYNGVDPQDAANKGIKVLNCPTQNSKAVAEHALALMFVVSRRIVEANTDIRRGEWNRDALLGSELGGKKLGLVGYGRIGKLIEQKVSGLEMDVRYVNSSSSDQEIDALLAESDIVCLCLSLNDETRQIIDRRRLGLLRPQAILINVARGGVVDQEALLEALKKGAIRGAGLDVYENEPPSRAVPADILELAKLPNVVATPHIAYHTEETITRLGDELFKNIESCINGDPLNVVNG